MTDPNNAPDVLSEDSGDPEVRGAQIDDGVYIVNEWVQQQAVPVAGLLAQATNIIAYGTLSEFLLSDHAAMIPPLRLFAPLLTSPNAGTFATRTLTRVPNYATDGQSPAQAQTKLLTALNRPTTPHTNTWKMTSRFNNNLAVLPNDNLAAATTRELWEISVDGYRRAVVYSWGGIDPNGTPWFRDYCFSTKVGANALITLPLKLLPTPPNAVISAVSSFQSQQIPNLAGAKIDAASRLQVAQKDLGLGRLASTDIVRLPNGINTNTVW